MPYGNLLADVVQSSVTGTPTVFKDGAGTETGQLCRAWVCFNGTNGSIAIRASFNVSSITWVSAGKWTVTVTNAFTDSNFAWAGSVNDYTLKEVARSSSTVQVGNYYATSLGGGQAYEDAAYVSVTMYR